MNMRTIVLLSAVGLPLLCVGCRTLPNVKVSDKLASEARQQLLAPPRHKIRLSMVDVPAAVRKIQQTYGWTQKRDMHLEKDFGCVKDVRVTIDREAGSLAEVLGDLCRQTGFSAFEDFDTVGIYGAIGYEETGGRNLAVARGGLLVLLHFADFQDDKAKTYSIFPDVIDAVQWLYHGDARLRIDELLYPDGTRIENLPESSFVSGLRFEPLVANRGIIKSIRGTLSLQLPLRVAVENVALAPGTLPKEQRRGHHFVRIKELEETKEGWLLACEFGYCSLDREELRLDYGHVDVLDEDAVPMDGRIQSVGSGGSGMEEGYKTFEVEYRTRPTSIRWTYVTEAETYSIPFHFTDCRVPDVIWKQDEREKKAQQSDGEATSAPAPSAGSEASHP